MATIRENPAETSLKDAIINLVEVSSGLKGTDLVIKLMDITGPTQFSHDMFLRVIGKLIKEGEVIELEYVLPHMDYRVKSIFFPKKTIVYVKN